MKSLAIVIMDSKFNGCLMHYVLVLMLLGNHWSLVLPASIGRHKCTFRNTVCFSNLLICVTDETLQKYASTMMNDSCDLQISDEIPHATVAGFNTTEKLRDIYAKNKIFSLHVSQLEIYMESFFTTDPILDYLSKLKEKLNNLLKNVECHIKIMDPLTSLPASPAALNLTHKYSFEMKVYGCGVLVRLKKWGQNVQQVMEDHA